ncbi:rhodanese-like domain-containing protein (plasmid) [Pseudomonas putida]|uniref:rhodanese-like domain-containing protein n=1 Tax=Pseudomonas putida TaxID=303 RepID=UPI001BB08417|nr:rhodanese-like domain-containing protein [Pseudomonas putida]QUG90273.1 rhodanese-like domain-containing protein [Pseudomonas putida]QUG92869.1 rhodanese-like domain-containing protein [Pseudomonas putida]
MAKHSEDFLRLANDARQRITEVAPPDARKRVAEGALLLDVRDKEEFETGHIEGAINISRGTLEMRIGEVAPDKHAPIVCHCGGGNRGALAADALQKMGYTQVVSIEGGLTAYKAEHKD